MSKNIDLTQPLSDFDREYLEVRGRWADIEKADAATGMGTSDDGATPESSGTGDPSATTEKTSEDFDTDAEWVESLTVSQLVAEIQKIDEDFVQGKMLKPELQAELLGLLEEDADNQ
jgi:hypothetical protein